MRSNACRAVKNRLTGVSSTLGLSAVRAASAPIRHASSTAGTAAQSASREERRSSGISSDRELILSVLNASTTKRDAKAYLQWFGSREETGPASAPPWTRRLALVLCRGVDDWTDETLRGVGRTLTHMHRLGLQMVVVTGEAAKDSGAAASSRAETLELADRLVTVLQNESSTSARRLDCVLGAEGAGDAFAGIAQHVKIEQHDILSSTLRSKAIPVIPSIAYRNDDQRVVTVPPEAVIYSLAKDLLSAGEDQPTGLARENDISQGVSYSVDKLIILDPTGGLPSPSRPDRIHVFVNLEQEYSTIKTELTGPSQRFTDAAASGEPSKADDYLRNLELAQKCLALLPATSSALLTSPHEAATMPPSLSLNSGDLGVMTRRPKNPLIFNLLTDKSLVSSSLPTWRIRAPGYGGERAAANVPATFFKRGMAVKIIPDPNKEIWAAPAASDAGIKLDDDARVDFARLLNLIEDSFNRKLDVDDYLARIQGRIAGIIVAGDYEGGAILTWELPPGATDPTRAVPYLDKFAVLKKSQGTGGVADVVFSAMVRTCFPDGVCWRSRRDNPVNRWYFERSAGAWKLPDSNWAMFWTTPGLLEDRQRLADYEAVCRSIAPSWADKKHIVD